MKRRSSAKAEVSEHYRVYWQSGCTSCLRAKEFLTTHDIAFESINVSEQTSALDELLARGIRAVPVIARGSRYVLGQDLDELAAFVGVNDARPRLSVPVLLERLARLLRVAEATTRALPSTAWTLKVLQRDRTYLDLGYHIAMVAEAFIDATDGAVLEFSAYELRAPSECQSADSVAAAIGSAQSRLGQWAMRAFDPDAILRTYFGDRPLHSVLERTAWHIAQHCRQLEHIVIVEQRAVPTETLHAQDLEGLPLPEAVWG